MSGNKRGDPEEHPASVHSLHEARRRLRRKNTPPGCWDCWTASEWALALMLLVWLMVFLGVVGWLLERT